MMKEKIFYITTLGMLLSACSPSNLPPKSTHNVPSEFNQLSYTPSNNTKPSFTSNSMENKQNFSEVKTEISSYTTPILTSDKKRYHNITLVRDRLNGYILKNGETFSYNEVCGPYGKKDGFQKADIQTGKGKTKKEYGGGVCQLSSTLYNAVKDLDIEIIERHHHSTPVNYVPKNQDATISLANNLDFKFTNVTGYDLSFRVTSTEDSLTVCVDSITKTP